MRIALFLAAAAASALAPQPSRPATTPEVVFKTDGRVVTTEEYSALQSGMILDPKLFDPESFTTVHWRQ